MELDKYGPFGLVSELHNIQALYLGNANVYPGRLTWLISSGILCSLRDEEHISGSARACVAHRNEVPFFLNKQIKSQTNQNKPLGAEHRHNVPENLLRLAAIIPVDGRVFLCDPWSR